MKKVLFVFFLLTFFYSLSYSQKMVPFTWDTYMTRFEIASDMDVKTNNSEKFEASNYDINLTIYPRKDEFLRFSQMANSLSDWARSSNVTGWSDITETKNLNGYQGVYLDGLVDGFPVFAGLLVHPDYPSNSMYIWISYRESEKTTAKKVLMSFTPTY